MEHEDKYAQYEEAIRAAQLNADSASLGQAQQEYMLQGQEKGMVSEQLDVGEVLDRIHNLLKGYVLGKNPANGLVEWMPPVNNDMIILSEYGVNYIMGSVQWYLNKNTLLSNYDDMQIAAKMEDFATTLTDDVFMEYDKMFYYPTLEDCQDEVERRIKSKIDIKLFARKLLGQESSEEDVSTIRKNILNDMEGRIEKELETIKQQKIKNKLKRFESLMRFVQDTVHSAYQRAWKGQERTTLRQHIHISENKGFNPAPPQGSSFNPLSAFRRK